MSSEKSPAQWSLLAVVSLGGALGAVSRYGLSMALSAESGGFPLPVLLINVSGCLAIGALMVVVTESDRVHPLVRPFLGVGVLGGYTTFSAYTQDGWLLLGRDPVLAAVYLAGTVVAALAATAAGMRLTRWARR